MATQLIDGRFRGEDAAGLPLVGGMLYTYASGTTTPKAAYTDATLGTAATNPLVLNARGEAQVWLGSGAYSLKLTDAAGVTIWTVDGVTAADSSGSGQAAADALRADLSSPAASKGAALVGAAVRHAATLADLRALPKTGAQRVAVDGLGLWAYDASDTTSADNGVTVIVAIDGGRWKLTTGDVGPILTATEGVTFANGYRSVMSGSLTVPTSNPGHVRYWTANYGLTVPAGATIPAVDVRHDHVALSARSRTSSVGSRIWGAVTLAHNDSPAASNADIGQCFGLEVDVNNNTGYSVTNFAGDGDIGGIIVASGGSSASKFGICMSKLGSAQGFYSGLWFRENVLHSTGYGIYFGNVAPSVGIRFGDDYTGGAAMQTNPGQDALYMRTTSGPYARIRSELDRLVMNCGNGGYFIANAANTENLASLSNSGLFITKGLSLGAGVILVTSTPPTFDATGGSRFQVQPSFATTITGFLTMGDGQIIRILAMNGNVTIQHNGGVQLAGGANYAMTAGSILTLERWGTVMREIGRVV
jgi:hypothetical protein